MIVSHEEGMSILHLVGQTCVSLINRFSPGLCYLQFGKYFEHQSFDCRLWGCLNLETSKPQRTHPELVLCMYLQMIRIARSFFPIHVGWQWIFDFFVVPNGKFHLISLSYSSQSLERKFNVMLFTSHPWYVSLFYHISRVTSGAKLNNHWIFRLWTSGVWCGRSSWGGCGSSDLEAWRPM